jgi:hypothetical protein
MNPLTSGDREAYVLPNAPVYMTWMTKAGLSQLSKTSKESPLFVNLASGKTRTLGLGPSAQLLKFGIDSPSAAQRIHDQKLFMLETLSPMPSRRMGFRKRTGLAVSMSTSRIQGPREPPTLMGRAARPLRTPPMGWAISSAIRSMRTIDVLRNDPMANRRCHQARAGEVQDEGTGESVSRCWSTLTCARAVGTSLRAGSALGRGCRADPTRP